MKRYILFDHDGVLVDSERWYYAAAERALADVGFSLDADQYRQDMNRGLGSWVQARAAGIDCAIVFNEFTGSSDFAGARHRIQSLAELAPIVLGEQ